MRGLNVLALDCGASGGRGIVGRYDGDRLALEDIHRFPNSTVTLPTGVYWNILNIYTEILMALGKAKSCGIQLDSIGIDAWAADYCVHDRQGNLLGMPHSYRDPRTNGVIDEVLQKIGVDELYSSTGLCGDTSLTLYQLTSMKYGEKAILGNAGQIQFIAGQLGYFLTGNTSCDCTQASGSLMLDCHTLQWNKELLSRLELPYILPEITRIGDVIGELRGEISSETGIGNIPILSVAGHDSCSAAAAIPASAGDDIIYISSGTWTVVGTFSDRPVISQDAFAVGFGNDLGFDGRFNFLRSNTGLWILQQCMREWLQDGYAYSYDDLEQAACKTRFESSIDPDSPEFFFTGGMNKKVAEYCRRTNQKAPENHAEVYACILNGISGSMSSTIDTLRTLLPRNYKKVYIVGGGARDKYLCKKLGESCGMGVRAGLPDATAVGNILLQLISLGELKDASDAAELVNRSFTFESYGKI